MMHVAHLIGRRVPRWYHFQNAYPHGIGPHWIGLRWWKCCMHLLPDVYLLMGGYQISMSTFHNGYGLQVHLPGLCFRMATRGHTYSPKWIYLRLFSLTLLDR